MDNMKWGNLDLDKVYNCFESLRKNVVFGIDGYVDEVWEVVESRTSKIGFKKYEQMKKFGELIVECGAGGLSTEIVRKRRTYGGFTANTGNAASKLGVNTTMIGLYGKDSIDPVFKEFEKTSSLYSIGDPAISNIMEFQDGKLMLVYIKEIMEIGWDNLINSLQKEELKKIFSQADIIALGYWSNMPAFDEFVSGITENFLTGDKNYKIFLDLADIRKRDNDSLHKTMEALGNLSKNIHITLSLNEHEAQLLFESYGLKFIDEVDLAEGCIKSLQKLLPLEEIIVHTPHFAAAVNKNGEAATVPQRYCEKPVRTTAAGDNFNGGYLAASSCLLSLWERLAVANAATSFFLQSGYSANQAELFSEIKNIKDFFS